MDFNNELANDFTQILSHVREENWDAFCEASVKLDVDPYVMLSRLLVGAVNERMEQLWEAGDQAFTFSD